MDDVQVAGYAVDEEVTDGEVEGWAGAEVDGDELDPEQEKMGRKEELEFMIWKLDMFEFEGGSKRQSCLSRGVVSAHPHISCCFQIRSSPCRPCLV